MQVVLVYLWPFWRSSLLKCVSQPEIAKRSLKPTVLGVQDHSRSSMLTFLRSLLPVLVMIQSMSLPICNHFHAKRANNTRLFRGYALFLPFVRGDPPWPSGMKFCHEILQTSSYRMVKTWSLYLTWSPNGSGLWQTDRIIVANMHYS